MTDTILAIVLTSAAQTVVYVGVLLWRLSALSTKVDGHNIRLTILELFKDRALPVVDVVERRKNERV